MGITTDSMEKSTKLNQIGFPEYAAKLVGDVFDSIVSANINQTRAYIELSKELSKDIATYINDTQSTISGTEILNFLVNVAPDINSEVGTLITGNSDNTLTIEQANKINESVSIPNTRINNKIANTSSQIKDMYFDILNAIARKISADKYIVLQQMIKQGMVRVIVNSGEMSTMLNFEARDYTFYQKNSVDYNRQEYKFRSASASGGTTSEWFNYASASNYSRLGVNSTTTEISQTSSTIQITGSLKLNFSTDYKSVNELTQ